MCDSIKITAFINAQPYPEGAETIIKLFSISFVSLFLKQLIIRAQTFFTKIKVLLETSRSSLSRVHDCHWAWEFVSNPSYPQYLLILLILKRQKIALTYKHTLQV